MKIKLALTLDVTRDREQSEDRETQRDALVERADPAERPVFGFQPRVTEEGRG